MFSRRFERLILSVLLPVVCFLQGNNGSKLLRKMPIRPARRPFGVRLVMRSNCKARFLRRKQPTTSSRLVFIFLAIMLASVCARERPCASTCVCEDYIMRCSGILPKLANLPAGIERLEFTTPVRSGCLMLYPIMKKMPTLKTIQFRQMQPVNDQCSDRMLGWENNPYQISFTDQPNYVTMVSKTDSQIRVGVGASNVSDVGIKPTSVAADTFQTPTANVTRVVTTVVTDHTLIPVTVLKTIVKTVLPTITTTTEVTVLSGEPVLFIRTITIELLPTTIRNLTSYVTRPYVTSWFTKFIDFTPTTISWLSSIKTVSTFTSVISRIKSFILTVTSTYLTTQTGAITQTVSITATNTFMPTVFSTFTITELQEPTNITVLKSITIKPTAFVTEYNTETVTVLLTTTVQPTSTTTILVADYQAPILKTAFVSQQELNDKKNYDTKLTTNDTAVISAEMESSENASSVWRSTIIQIDLSVRQSPNIITCYYVNLTIEQSLEKVTKTIIYNKDKTHNNTFMPIFRVTGPVSCAFNIGFLVRQAVLRK